MVAELPRFEGVINPIVEVLREAGYELEQLPCPEVTYFGLMRWQSTKAVYDTPGYRRHCKGLARIAADVMEKYIKEGYELVLVGLDGSPSSGVRYTGGSETAWGGGHHVSREQYRYVPGKGIWIEELEGELRRRGLPFPRATGVMLGAPDFSVDASVKEMKEFVSS